AKTRAVRERRTVPFSALPGGDQDADEPAVDPDRFLPAGHRWAGHWASPPRSWREVPEDRLLSRETMTEVERAVATLPAAQRAVLVLRDVEGLAAAEACQLLGLTEGNQRVLLHRARSKVRAALERYLDPVPTRP
ncbi:MAG TPA: sigma factor-like helix-turn-helix DNA-binding protein, partial [Actinomycetes bacterium]|nr:sigma factor-like helix-turn-helix DNA-binding protein [Actinomycetes bacterium]